MSEELVDATMPIVLEDGVFYPKYYKEFERRPGEAYNVESSTVTVKLTQSEKEALQQKYKDVK